MVAIEQVFSSILHEEDSCLPTSRPATIEAGIFEPSDGPTLRKQCLTVVDMGRHAAEVHFFGKNIQQKRIKT